MEVTLLPADTYQVINKSLLSEEDKMVLSMLYMPIIGNDAVMFYQVLYNELKLNNFISNELPHHHLVTTLNLSLSSLRNARTKLEGIGLLKTYYKEGSINNYIYEMYSPLSFKEFFNHPIFNIVLYNYVGKEEYNRLKNYFTIPRVNYSGYKEITSPFDMTFKSKNYNEHEFENTDIISKDKLKLSFELDYDIDLIISSIPKDLINTKAFNKSVKELIIDLSFIYEIDPISMSEVIKTCINEKGLIDKELLRKSARRYYQYNNNNKLPNLIFNSQPEYVKSASGDHSKRGRLIKVFEDNSPYEFLKAKNGGEKPTSRDMRIIEELLVDLKLNPAVVNVLVDYVLRTNNNKLNKNYIETIAGQWKRNKVETAEEAMNIAEKEHKKYRKETVNRKKEEHTPVWFDKTLESDELNEEEKRELEEMLNSYR